MCGRHALNSRCAARRRKRSLLLTALATIVFCNTAGAVIDLRNATREKLENGLTVLLLEDRNFPVVSVQMLYRVGARDEVTGQTGIAHFLEHMAFRDSANFPDTDLVSSIYAQGGEWHGYTWTDESTYSSTVPREHLDLLLRIEADRMGRLLLEESDMEAERGAVLAELHMYEADPTSLLIDAVLATSFLAHPYRNNTIGWVSDVEQLQHDEVVAFYAQHYHPANAIVAVVGDFDAVATRARIAELFNGFAQRAPTPLPRTLEPVQQGERRVRIAGAAPGRHFAIAYRAPAASHADYPVFLVLQEVVGAGAGANFLHNDWGTAIDEDAMLAGVAAEVTTWFPPSAQEYVFVIGGRAADDVPPAEIEGQIEARVAALRKEPPAAPVLAAAVNRVLDELVYDVETTEDAAHQLAFFEGLDALDILLDLPDLVTAVSAADVRRVAAKYLLPERRSIAWYQRQEPRPAAPADSQPQPVAERDRPRPALPLDAVPVPPPQLRKLSGGVPAIVQASDLSPSVHLRIVLPGRQIASIDARADDPVLGFCSLEQRFPPNELQGRLNAMRAAVSAARIQPQEEVTPSADPETRLEQLFGDFMHVEPAQAVAPALIVISGDIQVEGTYTLLEETFGTVVPGTSPDIARRAFEPGEVNVKLGLPVAQARLGFIVPAPGPREAGAAAWRLLLYVLSHDYEGRLGKEAISRRGLAYYIDSRYRSDGTNGWITLATGVDAQKLPALKALLNESLAGLTEHPPTEAEVAEAKAYLLGRARSAAQSNGELTAALAQHWLWHGELPTVDALARRLEAVSQADVARAGAAFAAGVTITIQE